MLCHIKRHRYLIFYTQIGAHKSAKIVIFALSVVVLHLICHIGMLVLKNAKEKSSVAICFGFRGKSLF